MTYTPLATQTIAVAGIPRTEYRSPAPIKTEICICFTPAHEDDEYCYTSPKFVFGDLVAIAIEYEQVKGTELASELTFHKILAIELVEPVVKVRGKETLSDAPYYLYGIRDSRIQGNLRWFMEEELLHKREIEAEIEPF